MKKYIYIIVPAVIVCLLGFFFLSSESSKNAPTDRRAPVVASMTVSVEVPDEVFFADEKFEMSRYDMHERFDREINSFTYWHSSTLLLIKRANRYFPIIEPILAKNGIPDDFKYLAVIESSLNPRAMSSAKASGMWQFIQSAAKIYGLEVGSEVDERYNVEKSTEAACKYLNDAYRKYQSWSSAALSYNAGQGRITNELSSQQAEDGLDLWLVEETSRYFFRIMAAKSIFENPYKYGFVLKADQLYKPIKFKQVEVKESISDLAAFAQTYDITYAQLKDFNSWLRDRKLTISTKSPKSYTLLIPEKESLYYKKGEKIKVHDKRWITE
ncbi:lytic transglycosylase domain-containing protein [Dysgonomonas sp. 216]|uniref:lytic transglycosylase domain-containing protein n=1 Tax=Dysgonomonas sp. 216 TaxID=2302934 RepID=UPI0013D2FCDF|nr:lytic transglycosylase domain-containing protein [Dysgonomonas sp. 216]NDW19494.1 lytic transglycosylase domain-containing protein [Dysgonomonas sp. 216]